MPKRKTTAPTIVDVAAKAGVSRATASRALSGYGRVNSATVDMVKQAAEAIGYRPNELARAMRAGKTKTIGLVIIADFTNAFFDRATKSIVDAASANGYQVLITNTDEDIAAERAAIETLLEKQVDGLIVVPSSTALNDHLSDLHRAGTPLVLIDRSLQGDELTSVTTNDFIGTSEAVRHAAALGHKRMAFLIATAGIDRFQENRPARLISSIENRVDGYLQGAKDCGIKSKAQSWLYCLDDPKVSEAAVAALLDQPKPPTIIFTSNNDMCLAVLKVAGNRQLAIGRDISLVTVDDSQWAAAIVPGITVVARPVEQLGQIAVQKLIDEMQHPGQPAEKIVLPTELIARQSIANLVLRPELDPDFRE